MKRRASLSAALAEIEAGALDRVARILVNRRWWEGLSRSDRDGYERRCERFAIQLGVDDRLSRHFVEVHGGSGGEPLMGERRRSAGDGSPAPTEATEAT